MERVQKMTTTIAQMKPRNINEINKYKYLSSYIYLYVCVCAGGYVFVKHHFWLEVSFFFFFFFFCLFFRYFRDEKTQVANMTAHDVDEKRETDNLNAVKNAMWHQILDS